MSPFIDPLKVMRSTATLEVYRQYQRSLRAAAQPWMAIAVMAAIVEVSLFLFGLSTGSFRRLGLVPALIATSGGLAFAIGTVRTYLYRRNQPF